MPIHFRTKKKLYLQNKHSFLPSSNNIGNPCEKFCFPLIANNITGRRKNIGK